MKPFLDNCVSVYDFTQLDESVIFFYFKEMTKEEDFILSDLTSRFLNRKLFKYKQLQSDKDLKKIQDISMELGYDPHYYIASDTTEQIPYLHYGESGELSEIEILTPEGKLFSLPDCSEIVSAILNSKKYKSDKKVFFPKEMKDEVSI